jgi:hypothetical protein
MQRTPGLNKAPTRRDAGERVRVAHWRWRLAIANLFFFGRGKIR